MDIYDAMRTRMAGFSPQTTSCLRWIATRSCGQSPLPDMRGVGGADRTRIRSNAKQALLALLTGRAG